MMRTYGLSLISRCIVIIGFCQVVAAQAIVPPPNGASLCSTEYALVVIRQQIGTSRTFDDLTQRVTVLIRAADLLWPHDETNARAAFNEAFELATQSYDQLLEKKNKEPTQPGSSAQDQRYQVIGAIARRDLGWAGKLIEKTTAQEAEEGEAKDPRRESETAKRLLDAAFSLLPSDTNSSIYFAKRSLHYPASVHLAMFFFRLAEVNQALADQFYQDAMSSYRNRAMSEFLYLSAYPFGNTREAGDMPSSALYRVPKGFTPNILLQRIFVQALLQRARQEMEGASGSIGGKITDAGQLWLALTRLEAQVQKSLPDLAVPTAQARGNLLSLLSQTSREALNRRIAADKPSEQKTFQEQVERAEKESSTDRRDELLALAIVYASQTEDLDQVTRAAEKIAEASVRAQVMNWLFFTRTQQALRAKQTVEARRLANRVEELDQRAFLYSEVAKEELELLRDRNKVLEILDEVSSASKKAPNNTVTARTLLALAYLYLNVDLNRSLSVLAEAIKSINQLEKPNFANQVVVRRIEGKSFGVFTTFQMPGFIPENVFRELGKVDFDDALVQAESFTDKSLRALVMLGLADVCLRKELQREQERKARKRK